MKIYLNFLSDSAVWETSSIFVDEKGNESKGTGESRITIAENEITNHSWVMAGENKLENNYIINKMTSTRYQYHSVNPTLGIQRGFFDINGNNIFSKFTIDGTDLNGYEVIRREDDVCYSSGALYKGNELVNTWTAQMRKM